ncbi:MAG: hypothetical protein WBY53_04170 [Acidobacteriaceae bacterium]
MSGVKRGLMLLVALVAMMIGCVSLASAQVSTTTVQDTVYSANGTPASGTVLVSWGSFTTAGGQNVPAGSASTTIGAGGQLSMTLAPNAGATPIGSYYTAVFHLNDGTTSRQYWVVPATVSGGGPATLAEIKSEVMPLSVAMQTVSKQYVDDAIAAAATGFPLDTSPYVQKAGDSMAGPLVLPADPVSPNQAADKNYVDENIAATGGGIAQKVSLLPSANQTISQPGGTSLSISGSSVNTTFSGAGTTSQSTITSANTPPGSSADTSLFTNRANCFEPGFDLGNNGTSAQGWSVCDLDLDVLESATRGISQLHGGNFSHFAQGDTAAFYTYLTSFGGNVASSDEAVTHTVEHTNQIGYYTGTIATGGTTGSNLLTTTAFSCHGFCGTLDNAQFADGGILLDTSRGGSTATLASQGTAMNDMYYTLSSGSVPVSTAWGNIVPSSCTNNGSGQWQNYTSTTCNVTLAISPASPNNFVTGTDVCLAGPFQEEAAVTAVGTPLAGVQSVTFNTRYAWNSGNAALMMQGGACGQSFVATNTATSWPVAYAVVGATSPTQVFFSNCLTGSCNIGGNIPTASVATLNITIGLYGAAVVRTGGVVSITNAFPWGYINEFPVGSTIVISGAAPADMNGTFTVASNTLDATNAVLTYDQAGANESATGIVTLSQPPVGITFYPSAFITGTNNGVSGDVNLATNQVAFATGDTVAGAPTSQFQNSGLNIYIGQTTSATGSNASGGIMVSDEGPSQLTDAYSAFNNIGNGVAPYMFNIDGSYSEVFHIGYRPANNGTLLYVQGNEPVSSNAKPYYIFQDNLTSGGKLMFTPSSGLFTFAGAIATPSVTATSSASAFASGTTIGGALPCLQNGTDCPAGSGNGSGGVTSVTMGAWPSWLTASVANATTTPTVAVAASAIPNSALANSSTTVNGQTCVLGGSCSIATGSSTPPLTYSYFPAAVSDGGVAFAGGFTRYSTNQPQAGSVAAATSAQGYLLFQATPALPQYAELTTSAPPYWTSTGMYLNFYSTATSGNAVLDVQTACVTPGQVVGSPTFSSAVLTTTPVSTTANGMVKTALISAIATPGMNGCPSAGMNTPTVLTVRVYADATSAVPVYFTGATLVVGRSQ